MVHSGRLRISDPEQFWNNVKPVEVKKSWQRTEAAIGKLVEFLTSTVRWTAASLIPSFNSLIPLVVVLANGDRWSHEDRLLARRWLLLVSVHGYFSGAAETQLEKVFRAIETTPSVTQLWATTKRSLPRLSSGNFETGRLSGPIMSLFLSMLRERGAKDWQNIHSPLDGTAIGHGATLHIHHFFPKALLNKHGERSETINTFANYTVISANTNINVSTEEPATYLNRLGYPESELSKQCIPLNRKLWHVSNYKDFLAERRKLLAKELNAYLGF